MAFLRPAGHGDETRRAYTRTLRASSRSRLPKQAEQTIRCLTFVAARRRVEGKALVHGV
jgi:hypothetical protein